MKQFKMVLQMTEGRFTYLYQCFMTVVKIHPKLAKQDLPYFILIISLKIFLLSLPRRSIPSPIPKICKVSQIFLSSSFLLYPYYTVYIGLKAL